MKDSEQEFTKHVELTIQEIHTIQNALNTQWLEANKKLDSGEPLGCIQKRLLEKEVEHSHKLLLRFENYYLWKDGAIV